MNNKIFIGFDSKEKIASDVCTFSIKKNSSEQTEILLLKLDELKKKKLYTREDDKLSSTEFSFTRFLVPYLMNYQGWAIFCDCDFLWIDDISKLFHIKNNNFAVMCVHHDYVPSEKFKMDGQKQLIYPRKNWSSMVLWNCSHPSNKSLNLELVNKETGKFLHRFGWLKDSEIGPINHEWNWLVNWYNEPKDGSPKAIHFTEGGPWFKNNKKSQYDKLWISYASEINSEWKKT